jgi:hypothetical protein
MKFDGYLGRVAEKYSFAGTQLPWCRACTALRSVRPRAQKPFQGNLPTLRFAETSAGAEVGKPRAGTTHALPRIAMARRIGGILADTKVGFVNI